MERKERQAITDVLIGEPGTGERLGRATVLIADEDLSVFEYSLEPGAGSSLQSGLE